MLRHRKNRSKKRENDRKTASDSNASLLTGTELECALNTICKFAQLETFPSKIHALRESKDLTKNNKLLELSPFLDGGGLLRVGGRLKNACIPYERKHSIILAPKHRLTYLIIKREHVKLMHAGCQAVLASTRMMFWILNGKNTIKKIIRECLTCFRVKPAEITCVMGDLPATRTTPARAFLNCGVAYAGPFLIKEKTLSRLYIKAYICIFVCFVTKAVHIELAVDLTTEAFLNCLKDLFRGESYAGIYFRTTAQISWEQTMNSACSRTSSRMISFTKR